MPNDLSISKRILWRYVNIKINRIIHHYHVLSVITILFDEMIKDLKDGKNIKIFNFGTLQLKDMKPRKHYDIVRKKIMLSEGHRILRFNLSPSLRKKLCKNLDFEIKDE